MQIGQIITQTKFEHSHIQGTASAMPISGKVIKIGQVNVWLEVPYMNGMTLEIKMKKELFT